MSFNTVYLDKIRIAIENLKLEEANQKRYIAALSADDLTDAFKTVYEKLSEASKIMNLTSITDMEGVCEKHIIDSVLPFVLLNSREMISENSKIVDVGTGAGFPAVPLSLLSARCSLFPSFSVLGIDSTGKKISYVNSLSESLKIKNLSALQARAENLSRSKARESFDIACARALSELRKLLELLAPLIKKEGLLVALKAHAEEEIQKAENSAKLLGLIHEKTIEYRLPSGDFRSVVIYRKVRKTPEDYPRNYSRISSDPL